MKGENGTPLTPDWIPESRDGEVRTSVKPTFDEALALWDGNWSHWLGDDG